MTRGERNCNPGNIDRNPANPWLGLAENQSSDPRFCVFTGMVYGVRALAKLLLFYQRKHGCATIRDIVSRWAPSNENDTAAYVADVAARMNYGSDDPLDLLAQALLAATTRAIIHHENGRIVPSIEAVMYTGTAMALLNKGDP